MNQEQWNPIPGYEGRYEISDQGRVRVAKRIAPRGVCAAYTFKARLLRKVKGGRANNYHRVMLMHPKRHAYVHHLVLETFVGPRPVDMVGCHRNDDGFDNRLVNLYWGTQLDNLADKARNSAPVAVEEEAVPF